MQMTCRPALIAMLFLGTVHVRAQESKQNHHNQSIVTNKGTVTQNNQTYSEFNFNIKVTPPVERQLRSRAKEEAGSSEGWLQTIVPANEPAPKLDWCPVDLGRDSMMIVGGNGAGGVASCKLDHCSVIHDMGANEDLLSLDRRGRSLVLNALVRDKSGKIIVAIRGGKTHVNVRNAYEWSRPDPHTIDVTDEFGRRVLHVRFLNPKVVSVKGYFITSRGDTAIIADDALYLRGAQMVNMCSTDNGLGFLGF